MHERATKGGAEVKTLKEHNTIIAKTMRTDKNHVRERPSFLAAH